MEDCGTIIYCTYCKEAISICSSYVAVGEEVYHIDCYELIQEDDEGSDVR